MPSPATRSAARRAAAALAALAALAAPAGRAAAQTPAPDARAAAPAAERVELSPGRVHPMTFGGAVTRVAVADTAVADVMVVSDRDVVFTGRRSGETDVLLWAGGQRRLYRVAVAPAADRPQVVLAVKFAEVRRDALRNIGVSYRYNQDPVTRNSEVGSDLLSTVPNLDPQTGRELLPRSLGYFSVLTDLGTRNFRALIDAEEQRGNARVLAEPTLMAGNRDSASFLAGGEIPVPAAVASTANGAPLITVVFKEFGVRLAFTPELLPDSLVKLRVRPEVSSLDYANAVVLSGVRIPALRARRLESTIDVPNNQSLVISGLLNDERQQVRTGIPGLMNLPVLGNLFSSTRWQKAETELLVIVTPTIVHPARPRAQDALRLRPEPDLPARTIVEPRLAAPPARPAAPGAAPTTAPRPTTPSPEQP
jgi:Flp pilus assembly secretin CpaC